MFDFSGKKALVTGAAHGIGLGIAQRLLKQGATVVAVDQDREGIHHAALPGDCIRIHGDVTNPVIVGEIVAQGPIQLIVQNAGTADPEGSLMQGDDRERERVFQTNLFAPWTLSRELAKELIQSDLPGSIVMISSLHSHRVRRMPAYSASKAALEMLIREMAWELGPQHIRVNGVLPGGVDTGLSRSGHHATADRYPLGRRQTPEDIAWMCCVLLEDKLSGQTTGETIRVDGGLDLYSWHATGQER